MCRNGASEDAAIDVEFRPVHVGGLVGGEHHGYGGDLLRPPEASQGAILDELAHSDLALRTLAQERFPHGCQHGGGVDRVAPDRQALLGAVERHGLRMVAHGGL